MLLERMVEIASVARAIDAEIVPDLMPQRPVACHPSS
jgi:hypothetical protein